MMKLMPVFALPSTLNNFEKILESQFSDIFLGIHSSIQHQKK